MQRKQKANKQQKRATEKMKTINEIESDDEKNTQPAHHTIETKSEMNEQHVETTEEESAKQEEQAKADEKTRKQKLPLRRETLQQENLQARRGERQRHKTDFYGNNVMISNNESPPKLN